MIRFDDVVVQDPRAAAPAVNGVSFEVPEGKITAIVGPNGSGKSTLVRALLGRVLLQRGMIDVDRSTAESWLDASPSCRSGRNRHSRCASRTISLLAATRMLTSGAQPIRPVRL